MTTDVVLARPAEVGARCPPVVRIILRGVAGGSAEPRRSPGSGGHTGKGVGKVVATFSLTRFLSGRCALAKVHRRPKISAGPSRSHEGLSAVLSKRLVIAGSPAHVAGDAGWPWAVRADVGSVAPARPRRRRGLGFGRARPAGWDGGRRVAEMMLGSLADRWRRGEEAGLGEQTSALAMLNRFSTTVLARRIATTRPTGTRGGQPARPSRASDGDGSVPGATMFCC